MLNFPKFEYKIKKHNNLPYIFDILRKKYVRVTPEEWVRQHLIHYLINNLGYPASVMVAEREVDVFGLSRRFDLVVFKDSKPWLLVECKAPEIKLNQEVFEQAFCYNTALSAPYIAITNGVVHYCIVRQKSGGYRMCSDFPCW